MDVREEEAHCREALGYRENTLGGGRVDWTGGSSRFVARREVAVKFTMNPNHQGERNGTWRRFDGFVAQETGFGEGSRECRCEPAGTPGNFGMLSMEIAAQN